MRLGGILYGNKYQWQDGKLHVIAGDHGTPEEGMIWYNSSSKKLKFYNGTIAVDPTDRGQHINTQLAATISDFDTQVRTNKIHQLALATADLDMNTHKILNIVDPTNPQEGATKNYVDNAIAGLKWKPPARAASTVNISLTGTQTVDGVALIVGDRILVKNQTLPENNGVYVVAAGAWARPSDADTAAEISGMAIMVMEGTTQMNTGWTLTTDPPITLGTTPLTFVQFYGGQAYIAGNGLVLTGLQFDVVAGLGISVAADSVGIDTTITARWKSFVLAGTGPNYDINHALANQWVGVQVISVNSPFNQIEPEDIERTDANNCRVKFGAAQSAGAWRAVVFG
jgi:hypothetical protein